MTNRYYIDQVDGYENVREYNDIVADVLQNTEATTEAEAREIVDRAIQDGELEEVAATAVRNINSAYGDPVVFETVEAMAGTIRDCGYELPEDGLQEGRDYEHVIS